MSRHLIPALAALAALSACATANTATRIGPDGRPMPVVYRISASDEPRVRARMRDGINAVREQRGLSPVELNTELTSAAATHSRDMSRQSRPWHFGSDGSTPLERVNRVGYSGRFLGELVSETYETELETLTAWMENRETRSILLDPNMREIGFAWHQDPNGKLWWTLTTGAPRAGSGATS
ncbi:MAG: CAP domain-containing protein [Pararhodobacter sp.]|nr:CAP domain-containing protein [Pararhodobacter sp.]